jgi:hypothetical protein
MNGWTDEISFEFPKCILQFIVQSAFTSMGDDDSEDEDEAPVWVDD